MRRLLHDAPFRWAVVAAALVWLLGYFVFAPEPEWAWPIRHPRDALYLGVLYPCIEELLFRGLLQGYLLEQPRLQRRWYGLTHANLVTSALFTLLHFLAHPPLAALAVLVPSLIFGYFRDRHGSLHAPILLHVYYNLGYFWIFAS
ncbi:MAG: JDVT-CTERM system CAAX-type protease [Gammaproteobacteria bacterium]|nr:JDVT-CTERM system CAAX-type protease [Gammaproteobacteria bacterium]